jgi:hypothetical protein
MSTTDMWTYPNSSWQREDLTDFDVEAVDGGIGKVDEATYEIAAAYIVVDTGPWIFGKKVLLPAGVIDDVDLGAKKIYVNRSKDEIKNAPEFNEDAFANDDYRRQIGSYYAPGGAAYREPRDSAMAGRRGR